MSAPWNKPSLADTSDATLLQRWCNTLWNMLTAPLQTFFGSPTSANLRALVTDESGTGALLFAGGDIGAATGTSLATTGALTGSNLSGTHKVIASSAAAVSCGADTTEDVLATITIPANAMGANGMLEIWTGWSSTSSGNSKTVRVRFSGASGTQYMNDAETTNSNMAKITQIYNRNATNSQVGGVQGSATGIGVASVALATSAVDTTGSSTVVVTGQKANSGETLTLEWYRVMLIAP